MSHWPSVNPAMIAPPDNSALYRSREGYEAVMANYDAAFQRMGMPHETRYVETRFGPTHAVITGRESGRPLVLWHGLNANATTWVRWMPALAPAFRLYAIDTIGGLGKSAPGRPPRKGPAYGQWAAEALEGLGLERANMMGASNGAWLIGKLAGVAPDRIDCAVLMSPAGFSKLNVMQAVRLLPQVLFKPPEEVERLTLAGLSPPDLPLDPDLLALFELIVRHYRGEPLPTVLRDDEIGRLAAPAYLLVGQFEALVNPYQTIKRALALLPNAIAAEVVPGVGHAMEHRRPGWVTDRVLRFLEQYAA